MLILDIFSCTGGNAIDAAVGAAICAAVALPHLASLGAQTLLKVSSFNDEVYFNVLSIIGSVTSLCILKSICLLVGWPAGRSVYQNFLKRH